MEKIKFNNNFFNKLIDLNNTINKICENINVLKFQNNMKKISENLKQSIIKIQSLSEISKNLGISLLQIQEKINLIK